MENKNQYIIGGLAVIVLLAGALLYVKGRPAATPSENPSGMKTPAPVKPLEPIVTYTDQGYSANFSKITAGETVTFKNQSSGKMWTASAAHPTHNLYPARGGCIASAFDECKGDPAGSIWQFRFNLKGTWKYHNHVKPEHTGSVVVE